MAIKKLQNNFTTPDEETALQIFDQAVEFEKRQLTIA